MARPWEQRAIELEPTQGHYADYVAWEQWFDAEAERIGPAHDTIRDLLDAYQQITLYCMFCRAFDQQADTPVVVEHVPE